MSYVGFIFKRNLSCIGVLNKKFSLLLEQFYVAQPRSAPPKSSSIK